MPKKRFFGALIEYFGPFFSKIDPFYAKKKSKREVFTGFEKSTRVFALNGKTTYRMVELRVRHKRKGYGNRRRRDGCSRMNSATAFPISTGGTREKSSKRDWASSIASRESTSVND